MKIALIRKIRGSFFCQHETSRFGMLPKNINIKFTNYVLKEKFCWKSDNFRPYTYRLLSVQVFVIRDTDKKYGHEDKHLFMYGEMYVMTMDMIFVCMWL